MIQITPVQPYTRKQHLHNLVQYIVHSLIQYSLIQYTKQLPHSLIQYKYYTMCEVEKVASDCGIVS